MEVGAGYCLCGPQTFVVRCTNIVHYRQSPYSRNEFCPYIIAIITYKKQQQQETQREFTTKTSKRRRKKKRKKEVREKQKLIFVFTILHKINFFSVNVTAVFINRNWFIGKLYKLDTCFEIYRVQCYVLVVSHMWFTNLWHFNKKRSWPILKNKTIP